MQVLMKKNSNNGCATQLFLVLHKHVTNGNNVAHCESHDQLFGSFVNISGIGTTTQLTTDHAIGTMSKQICMHTHAHTHTSISDTQTLL